MRASKHIAIAAATLTLGTTGQAFAVDSLIGDVDGFGYSPTTGLVRATGSPHTTPADTDGDGILEPGEFLPDLNKNGGVCIGCGDDFDHRSPAEVGDSIGSQWTDRSVVGNGAANGATFTFTFAVPVFGDDDYGVDHFINFVFGDYDVTPASIKVDGVIVPLTTQGGGQDGLVQKASSVVPWATMTDGEVIIQVIAPNEPYLAFDYALLSTDQIADQDGDGVPDSVDNCVFDPNTDQADADGDGVGNACDGCHDPDADGVCGDTDNCPSDANADQVDSDGDGAGDACDACPNDADDDADGDGVCGDQDNCASEPNADQQDGDGDGMGDGCDPCPVDAAEGPDGDGVCSSIDNCPNTPNAAQTDSDGDGVGDACDGCEDDPENDADHDGVCGNVDWCDGTVWPESVPTESLGVNRWALLNGDTVFDTVLPSGKGPKRSYSLADTGGCSCSQIIDALALGEGHTKFGCSISAMDDWVSLVNEQ